MRMKRRMKTTDATDNEHSSGRQERKTGVFWHAALPHPHFQPHSFPTQYPFMNWAQLQPQYSCSVTTQVVIYWSAGLTIKLFQEGCWDRRQKIRGRKQLWKERRCEAILIPAAVTSYENPPQVCSWKTTKMIARVNRKVHHHQRGEGWAWKTSWAATQEASPGWNSPPLLSLYYLKSF